MRDLDAVSQALKTHFGKMSVDELKVSVLLQGQIQSQSHANLLKKTTTIETKISLAKEVTQQKVLINSRKTDFRISKARLRKKDTVEKRQCAIEDAFNNKNKKILEERDQTLQRLKNYESWQKQWINTMNVMILIEKVASIRRASEFS